MSIVFIKRSKVALVNASRKKFFFSLILMQLYCIAIHGQLESTKHCTLLVNVWALSWVEVANCHTSAVSNDTSMFYYVKAILEVPCLKSIGRDWTTGVKGGTKLHRGNLRSEMCVCVKRMWEAKCVLCVWWMFEVSCKLCILCICV